MTMSLRARLLLGMGFVAVVLAAVSVFIIVRTSDQMIDQVDDRLATFSPVGRGDRDRDANDIDGPLPPPVDDGQDEQAAQPDDEPPPPPDGDQPERDMPDRQSDVYEGFILSDGTLDTRFTPNVGDRQYAAPDIDADDLPDSGGRFLTTEAVDGDVTYRVLVQRVDEGGAAAVTALPIDDVQSTIRQLIIVVTFGALLILAALGVVSWWVIRLGIRPVKRMTQAATQIAGGDLAVRVPEPAHGTESGELAEALNQMLGRIETAMDERAESEERLRRFVADASHELRTPVTTIRGYAELYRHGGLANGDALDDAMRRTEEEAQRMGRLVEDMLTLAKLDEQRPLQEVPVNLARLARDAGADAHAAWPERVVRVEIEAPDDDLVVLGDEDRLRQVIANVVGNAFVHTGADAAVSLRVTTAGGAVTFEVSDTGDGMPSEVAERVTERFFRADPARARHRGGSGLGLSIVDATVTAHGGSFDVDSEPGRGTAIRITLPTAPTPTD